jgi:putative glutamine amidotransferase
VIGLCAAVERARWTHWDDEAALLSMSYVRHVQAAEGIAVLLPPDPEPEAVLGFLDGLVLTGGADIGDAPERDAFELALAGLALERDKPVLGVCRGMQVMNVARGGTLIPHLPDAVGHEDHRAVLGAFGDHDVRLRDGSLAQRVVREDVHPQVAPPQGVDRVGAGFEVTGWARSTTCRGVEDPSKRFALGVQWHPRPTTLPADRGAGEARDDAHGIEPPTEEVLARSSARAEEVDAAVARAKAPSRVARVAPPTAPSCCTAAGALAPRAEDLARSRRATPASRSATRAARWHGGRHLPLLRRGAERLLGDTIPWRAAWP